jgi:hypothetical protein
LLHVADNLEQVIRYRQRGLRVRARAAHALHSLAIVPDRPHFRYTIWKFTQLLPLYICDDPVAAETVLWWCDETRNSAAPQGLSARPVVNGRCLDISKTRVEKVFREAFGYTMEVDPRTHVGPCVKKSNRNSTRETQLLRCPISALDGNFVYQMVIDNRVPGTHLVMDYRLVIMGHTIPVAFRVYRPLSARFDGEEDVAAELVEVKEILTTAELERTFRFTDSIGLDYGELDVLRDDDTKRLYIVDANKTPFGPPYKLSSSEKRIAIRKMADAFWHGFIER